MPLSSRQKPLPPFLVIVSVELNGEPAIAEFGGREQFLVRIALMALRLIATHKTASTNEGPRPFHHFQLPIPWNIEGRHVHGPESMGMPE